jgi:hypothetical protein
MKGFFLYLAANNFKLLLNIHYQKFLLVALDDQIKTRCNGITVLYSDADLTGPNTLFEPKCIYCTVIHCRITAHFLFSILQKS